MVLTQYLVDLLASGEAEPFSKEELLSGWSHFLVDQNLLTERLNVFMSMPAFADAVYALYESMQAVQELMLTAPRMPGERSKGFLSALVHQGWIAQDMVVAREITSWRGE